MAEIFTRMKGFEHKYEISLSGSIRSIPGANADGRYRQGRLVVHGISGCGTRSVGLERRDGTRVTRQVARLVLETYYRPANPGEIVHYKDGQRANLWLENLSWGPPHDGAFWEGDDRRYERRRKAAKARRPVMYVTKRDENYDPPGW